MLAFLPPFGHGGAHDGADDEHDARRDQCQQRELVVHTPHFKQCQQPQHRGIEEHQDAVTETLLNGVQVVGVEAHQVADLVDLVVLLGQLAAVVKHPLPQIGSDQHRRAKETDAPQKPPDDHQQHDPDHGQADMLEQHLFGKGEGLSVDDDLSQVNAVDDQAVQLGDHKLDIIDRQQRQQAQKQHGCTAQIIPVDILAEDHGSPSFSLFLFTVWQNSRIFQYIGLSP